MTQQINLEEASCIVCGSRDYDVLFYTGDFRYYIADTIFRVVRCKNCGLIYLNPKPVASDVEKLYPSEYHMKEYPSSIRKFGSFLNLLCLREITEYKKKGRILDIGCGDGSFLSLFKERGWEVWGIDISEAACRKALHKLGYKSNIQNRELKACGFPDNFFDVIILKHVIEHVYDPNVELNEIIRILKDDGILLIETPNVDSYDFKICGSTWLELDPPRHLNLFSVNTLVKLLSKSGFYAIKVKKLRDMPLSTFYSLRTKYLRMFSNRLARGLLLLALALFSIISKQFFTMSNIRVIAKKSKGSQVTN